MSAITTIDAYIAAASPQAQPVLRRLRKTVREAAPDAEETISYRMPALRGHRMLVYFAAFKHHIGLFPPVKGDASLDKALSPYRGPKGNLRFPLDEDIPYALIARLVRWQVKQDRAKESLSKKRTSKKRRI